VHRLWARASRSRIWPHENSLIVAGLVRYEHQEAARTIAASILAAAPYFEHRLPEVFAGFPNALTSVPVAFPTASRPQAWAAGAPLLLLSTLLSLQPEDTDAEADLPDPTGHVSIRRDRAHDRPQTALATH
jgi:glycogen debranching enzyme